MKIRDEMTGQYKKARGVITKNIVEVYDHLKKAGVTVTFLTLGVGLGFAIDAIRTEGVQAFIPNNSTSYVASAQTPSTVKEFGYEVFNSDLQKYIRSRVEIEMENPKNKEAYRKQVEDQVTRNINILTKTSF